MSSTIKLWQEFEKLEHQINEKIQLCATIRVKSNYNEEKECANYEINALYFGNHIRYSLDPAIGSVSYESKNIDEIILRFRSQCDQKSIGYYQACYKKTSNIFDKWRYAFCYWVLTKDPVYKNNALDYLFTSIERCLQRKNYEESESLLVMTFNISRYYNLLNDEKRKEKNRIINQALELIVAVKGTEHSHRMIKMVKVLTSIKNGISPQIARDLIFVLHDEERANRAKYKRSRYYRFFEVSLDLCDKLQDPDRNEQKHKIHLMLAESFEKDADSLKQQGDNHILLAYDHYKRAEKWYLKLNDTLKIKHIAQKIDSLSLGDKLGVIEAPLEMTKKRFTSGNNGYELVKEILRDAGSSIPSVSDITEKVNQDLEEHPLSQAVRNINLGRKNPISVDDDKNSIAHSMIIRRLWEHIDASDLNIANALLGLENDGKITAQDFINVLSDYGLDNDLLELIRRGMDRHFAKDYISSIHILTPQIEATLRYLQNNKGIRLLKVKEKDTIMDLELGNLLRDKDTRNLLGEDFVKYLEVKFTDPKGMNLRNEVSHGLLPYEEFNHVKSLSVIVAIILLAQRLLSHRTSSRKFFLPSKTPTYFYSFILTNN